MRKGYCKLFVNSSTSRRELIEAVALHTNGIVERSFIDSEWGDFDVRINDEYSCRKSQGLDGFLYYKYIIDADATNPQGDLSDYIENIQDLISALRSTGATVVAACDFEDQLQ